MTPHVLIAGGGYVGMYTAFHLRRAVRRGTVAVTVVDPRPVMTYQPFLPEAAAGSLEPRHVVVPLRAVLRGCRVITCRITSIDHANHRATVEPPTGEEYGVDYDHVVVALGSVARTLPIPGLAEQVIGFKHVEEAILLRNQVLGRLDLADSMRAASIRAASTDDEAQRRRALRRWPCRVVRRSAVRCRLDRWTAGVKATPAVSASGLPLDERSPIRCGADLRVVGFDDAWAAGDNAAVPDLSSSVHGATCSPSAQHAVRQAKVLAPELGPTPSGARTSTERLGHHDDLGDREPLGYRDPWWPIHM